ncbi:transmembrane protein 141 isoform X2 [Lethenteron reissneri]|uniref:transmembrane protein 141 isoform X2 n=1 Tax=Lethenteron reissneri TaxID=7753 RepID=UPI002AB5FC71|nr:transmembrane protein 141 isoform X2 [Lethenteron reissneri]
MVSIGLARVDDSVAGRHPGLQSYSACTSFALMKGTAVLVLGTPAMVFLQSLLKKRLPYSFQWNILTSVLVSSVVSYSITRREVGKCGENWIRFEKGELPQDLTDAVEQPEGASPSAGSEHETAPGRTKYGDVLE